MPSLSCVPYLYKSVQSVLQRSVILSVGEKKRTILESQFCVFRFLKSRISFSKYKNSHKFQKFSGLHVHMDVCN